jgi:outer membrane biosynthesis protein TonB
MKKITDQMKKSLILGIGMLLSIVLIVLIAGRFLQNPELELSDAAITTPVNNISPEKISFENPLSSEKEVIKEIIVEPIVIPDEPTEENSAVDKGTEQTIQGDIPEKPVYTEAELTNPTQKPTGEKVEPDKKDEEQVSTESQNPIKDSSPAGGDTKQGQIFVPGFGWVKDEGGGAQGTTAEDMFENGNKIGNMD